MSLHTLPHREPGERHRLLLRTDGTVMPLPEPLSIDQLTDLCDVDLFDTVNMTQWEGPLHVLLVDDIGAKRKPRRQINVHASELYWSCLPGSNPPPIYGDAVLVPDDDFALD